EGEESVQRGIGDDVVAADPYGQLGTDERNGREQVHNNLCAPVRHLAPRQQIAEEGFAHETEEDGYAEDPDQFARLAVRTVKQAAQHVQVHHHEEHGGTRGVHIADQPAPRHFTHDVFDRFECKLCVGFVIHDQDDTGHDLQVQHQA